MQFLLENVEASFMKFLVGAVNTDTLVKQNEAWVLDWEYHRDALPRNILKNPEKTALTKHAAQSGYAFSWDYAHVLHRVNNYHTLIFLESLYNTVI